MNEAERAAALGRYLRARREIDGPGVYVHPDVKIELLSRLSGTGMSSSASSAGAPTDPVGADPRAAAVRMSSREIEELDDLNRVRVVAEGCTRCGLAATRTNVVFADGSPRARVMCVGEAPGAREDATGVPFVGRAGKLLDRLLASVGLGRQEVYICNVLKCRPPGNRNPLPEEIRTCSPFLRRQVALVGPEVIVAFGTFASRTLLGLHDSLGRMRGRTHEYEGVPLVVTYHPAALLRNPHWSRPAWEDLQRVRKILAGGGS